MRKGCVYIMSKTAQKSYFTLRGYFSADEVEKLVALPFVRHWAFCFHDKDVKGEKTIASHYHFCINTIEKMTWKSLKNKVLELFPNCNPNVEEMKDIEGAYDYLIHDTEEAKKVGKYQYDVSERKSDNPAYWVSAKDDFKNQKIDLFSAAFVEFIESGYVDRRRLADYMIEGGRDLILNAGRLVDSVAMVLGTDKVNVFHTAEERDKIGVIQDDIIKYEQRLADVKSAYAKELKSWTDLLVRHNIEKEKK